MISAKIGGEDTKRSYTPISIDERAGECELMIKVYRKNVLKKFPNGGAMT
jgi:NAD(P)H-flavin reductase